MNPGTLFMRNTLLTLGIGTFLFMSLFGSFQSVMGMSMDGAIPGCPIMPGMSMCAMSPLEHISLMQSFFTGITQQENPIFTLLLALTFFACLSTIWFRRLFSPSDSDQRALLYFYRKKFFSILGLLQELFSQGILNPKPF